MTASEPAAVTAPATAGDEGTDAPGGAAACEECGAELVPGARFCEACGDDIAAPSTGPRPTGTPSAGGADEPAAAPSGDLPLGDDEPATVPSGGDQPAGTASGGGATAGAAPQGGRVADAAPACSRCGAEVGVDGYCTRCGHRALEQITVDDRGPVAYAGHRGRRHHRNEDSCALGATSEGWPVLVVSDGVSVSPNPHKASAAAVTAATRRLAGRPFTGPDDLVAAVADAHEAASAISADGDPHWVSDGSHPACTIVVAVATDSAVHVANVGDARAHLVTAAASGWAASQLTTDDSIAAHAVAQGLEFEVALALPGGHGITAWLGADAPGLHPHLASRPAERGDLLVVSSDGLWNYAASDDAMSDLLTAMLPPPPADRGTAAVTGPLGLPCERMVHWAIDQGGADNITVAVAPVPPAHVAVDPAAADPATDDNDPSELEDNP